MLKEQLEQKIIWTPSKIIARLGKEINNPSSVYYWAWKVRDVCCGLCCVVLLDLSHCLLVFFFFVFCSHTTHRTRFRSSARR